MVLPVRGGFNGVLNNVVLVAWSCSTTETGTCPPGVTVMLPPLVFEPYFRPQVWGESRLRRLLNKPLPSGDRIGESWEISSHPLHVSRVAEGPFAGASLNQIWDLHRPEFLGLRNERTGRSSDRDRFPLLVKLLDCHERLSVQVHPDDATARELLGEPNGKTEAWVVLHAEPGSRIYAGLKSGVSRTDLEQQLTDGDVTDCLSSFEPQAGDGLLIPAGTVHAIGGGVLIAEVQQTSDATFRLFDWNRVSANGRVRELHRTESLRSIHFDVAPVSPIQLAPCRCVNCHDEDQLITCDYFSISRVNLRASIRKLDAEPLTAWMVTSGTATLQSDFNGYDRRFHVGETVLIPGCSRGLQWSAEQATLLRIQPTPLA